MTQPHHPEPTDGYLDDDFAKFRAERLAGKAHKVEASEAPSEAPPAGYMDDDFAKFRAERLKNTPPKASARLKPHEGEGQKPAEGEEGMFFGTNSNERRRNHAEAEEQRRDLADVPVPPPAGHGPWPARSTR